MSDPKSPEDRSSDSARVFSLDVYRDRRDAGVNDAMSRHPAYKAKLAREAKNKED